MHIFDSRKLIFTSLGACLLFLMACGGPAPSTETISGAPPAREVSQNKSFDNGNYVINFNIINTELLDPEISRKYDVTRSKNRALVNISVQKKNQDGSKTPVTAVLNANVSNLTGQLKKPDWRKIEEAGGAAIYYIGLIRIANGETLVIDMNVLPDGENDPIPVRFQQRMFTD
ncbi:MAG: DUF4426 domain-containing protein [Gammaproteobacteria bacterium]|nr:DUF4426 domain-containing protein [Gammaproteobacteria bacterium]NNC97885.1 DUF4426 domain-containing protein [Gammaproteobacteria bacterium]NNM13546.1 DUF4426 domain-containing protein [Gammaproteobacteria bacterium]